MMIELTRNIDDRLHEAKRFLADFRTAILSSCTTGATPDASYAPFVRRADNCFYIFISGLAKHTNNLLSTHRASLLFIEDEGKASQVFARTRMTFDCQAQLVAKHTPLGAQVLALMHQKFGKVVEIIEPLPDFRLFRLLPKSCSYVTGFANAFHFSRDELAALESVNDECPPM